MIYDIRKADIAAAILNKSLYFFHRLIVAGFLVVRKFRINKTAQKISIADRCRRILSRSLYMGTFEISSTPDAKHDWVTSSEDRDRKIKITIKVNFKNRLQSLIMVSLFRFLIR